MSFSNVKSRKGFKFVQGKSVFTKDVIAFDEIEKDSPGAGSKRKSSDAGLTAATSSSKAPPASATVERRADPVTKSARRSTKRKLMRHHYPNIPLEEDETEYNELAHSQKFKRLVGNVCARELSGLLDHFEQDQLLGESERQNLQEAVTNILSKLPKLASSGITNSTKFDPEFSLNERQEYEALLAEREKLQEYSDMLEAYAGNLDQFAKEQALWLGKVPSRDDKSSTGVDGSAAVASESSRYGEMLNSMDKHCTTILSKLSSTSTLLTQAGRMQSELFENFNRIRTEAAVANTASSGAPRDAKDMLRAMPSLL